MSMAHGASNDDEGIATTRRAYELGIDFFDTAELYGAGTGSNEILLDEAVKGFRDEVVLATKFGFDMTAPPSTAVRKTSARLPRTACATCGATTSTSSTSTSPTPTFRSRRSPAWSANCSPRAR